jgi:hypothetical protein
MSPPASGVFGFAHSTLALVTVPRLPAFLPVLCFSPLRLRYAVHQLQPYIACVFLHRMIFLSK